MKKPAILFLTLFFAASMAFAQFEKGNMLLAGYSNLGLDIGKQKYKYNGTTSENFKYFEFNLTPEAGYFVIDKLAVGAFLDVDLERYKYTDDDIDLYTKFIIGPVARYYIIQLDKLNPFVEGRIGIGAQKYKTKYSGGSDSESKYSYFTTKLGVGNTTFLTEKLGLDLFIGYDYDVWTEKNDDSGGVKSVAADDSKELWSSVEINLGLSYFFSK